MPGDRTFDFSELDAMAANLHLAVAAPAEHDTAIGQISAQVAGSIADVTLGPGKGVDHELFLGQRCITVVTQGQIRAAYQDLPDFAFADQPIGLIDQQQLCAFDTFAQRDP
ncbi:hypothetical protein D3C76_760150 [compost metagenome]